MMKSPKKEGKREEKERHIFLQHKSLMTSFGVTINGWKERGKKGLKALNLATCRRT